MDVYIKTSDRGMEVLEVPDGSSDLPGFESWRHSVWGSDRVRALGAEFFPALATDDLFVEPSEVERFQRECALLRANLEIVAGAIDPFNPRSAELRMADGRYQLHEPDDPHAAFVATVNTALAGHRGMQELNRTDPVAVDEKLAALLLLLRPAVSGHRSM